MEDRKILVEVTKEELELLQNGFKEPKNEEDEQPAHLIHRLLNKLDGLKPTKESNCNNIGLMGTEKTTIKSYDYSNFEITIFQNERCKPRIQIVYK